MKFDNDRVLFFSFLAIFVFLMGKSKDILVSYFNKTLSTDLFPLESVSREKKVDLMAEKLPRVILHIFFSVGGWLILYDSPWLHTSLGGTTETV